MGRESVRDVTGRDQDRLTRIAEMQRLVTEGLDSGIGDRTMTDLLQAASAQAGVTKPSDYGL